MFDGATEIYILHNGTTPVTSNVVMKVETTLPLQKEARILQYTKDESLASFQWCLLRIAHNYPLLCVTTNTEKF